MASNTGALVTLPSSLAGLLWHRILSQKGMPRPLVPLRRAVIDPLRDSGIRISQRGFSLINFIPVCIVTFVSLSIVLVEVLYWI